MTAPTDLAQLRAEFEHWYATHAHNYSRDPIGSRDCSLQWEAWKAAHESRAQPASDFQPRFFIDHGVIHDRKRGRHVLGSQRDAETFGEPLQDTVDALNAMESATQSIGGLRVDYLDECRAQAQPASDQIFKAYKTWPADIRRKLSAHDLRRMTGWTPNKYPGGWEIDTSTGTPILTHEKCSVIQDDEAHYVMGLIEKAAQPASVADGRVMVPREPDEAMLAAIDELRPPSGSPEQITSPDFRSRWRDRHRRAAKETYVAMLAAAPQPPANETHQVVLSGKAGGGVELVEIVVPVAPQPAKSVCNRNCDCMGECKAGVE